MKFCLSYGSVKKEQLYIEFLKVAQECALMGIFNTRQEIIEIIEFAFAKFQNEVMYENSLLQKKEQQKQIRSQS